MIETNATTAAQAPTTVPDAAFEQYRAAISEVIRLLLNWRLEPMEIPLPASTKATPQLDALEHDVFITALDEADDEDERHAIHCEHGGFRIMRHIAEDDLVALSWLVHGSITPTNDRLRRVLDFFRSGPSIQ